MEYDARLQVCWERFQSTTFQRTTKSASAALGPHLNDSKKYIPKSTPKYVTKPVTTSVKRNAEEEIRNRLKKFGTSSYF